jgi:Bacterial PH domain
MFRRTDLVLIPFSIVWSGGFGVALWGVLAGRARLAGPPFRALVLLVVYGVVALYVTVGRFITDMIARSRTTYAVTTERVIIQSGMFVTTLQSLNLRTLTNVSLSEGAGGSGTIVLGPPSPFGAWSYGVRLPGIPQAATFEHIPRAREVYAIIRDAQRSSAAASAR